MKKRRQCQARPSPCRAVFLLLPHRHAHRALTHLITGSRLRPRCILPTILILLTKVATLTLPLLPPRTLPMAHHGLLMCIITGMVVLSPLQATLLLNSNNTGGWHRLLMVAATGFITNINHTN